MPAKVSVIIPVHNAQAYLEQCLDSLLGQTLKDLEIICVNDASTDASAKILDGYAEKDSRIRIIATEKNVYAGNARNMGLNIASGEYLAFLDADDFFEASMLEEAYCAAKSKEADVVLLDADLFFSGQNAFRRVNWVLEKQLLPQNDPFCAKDIPDWILHLSSPAPWNKLIRRVFVLEQDLRFQGIRSSNDIFFSLMAMILAQRITAVPKILMHYRTGTTTSLQATQDKNPLDVYNAFIALKEELIRRNVFSVYERSFVNKALHGCLKGLNALKSDDAFQQMYVFLRETGFHALNFTGKRVFYYLTPLHIFCYMQYRWIMKYTLEVYRKQIRSRRMRFLRFFFDRTQRLFWLLFRLLF